MAKDLEDLKQCQDNFKYHPCDTPRGTLYYDTTLLTDSQQTQLNDFKIQTNREDEMYLANNPEIRAMIVLVTKHILKLRPRTNLHEFIGSWFLRPRDDIDCDIRNYLATRDLHITEGDSAVISNKDSIVEDSEDDMKQFCESENDTDLNESIDEIDMQLYLKYLINEKISDFPSDGSMKSQTTEEELLKSFLNKNERKIRSCELHDDRSTIDEIVASEIHYKDEPKGVTSRFLTLLNEQQTRYSDYSTTTVGKKTVTVSTHPGSLQFGASEPSESVPAGSSSNTLT